LLLLLLSFSEEELLPSLCLEEISTAEMEISQGIPRVLLRALLQGSLLEYALWDPKVRLVSVSGTVDSSFGYRS
jgi:hypothetical protein